MAESSLPSMGPAWLPMLQGHETSLSWWELVQRHFNLLKNRGNVNRVLHLYQFKRAHARTLRSSGLCAQCTAQYDFFSPGVRL